MVPGAASGWKARSQPVTETQKSELKPRRKIDTSGDVVVLRLYGPGQDRRRL